VKELDSLYEFLNCQNVLLKKVQKYKKSSLHTDKGVLYYATVSFKKNSRLVKNRAEDLQA